MDKRPEIFKPNMKFVDNNKKAFYSYLEEASSDEPVFDKSDVVSFDTLDFINKLTGRGSYVFNKDVVIVTKDGEFETRIAGRLGNRIVTLDNNSISIDDIVKIYEKK